MDAILSDITAKVAPKKQSYKVDILNRDSGTHLEIDGTFEEFNAQNLKSTIGLALQNGKKWYKLTKVDDKWTRVEVD